MSDDLMPWARFAVGRDETPFPILGKKIAERGRRARGMIDEDEVQEGECHSCGHGESFHTAGGECEVPGCDCDHFSG